MIKNTGLPFLINTILLIIGLIIPFFIILVSIDTLFLNFDALISYITLGILGISYYLALNLYLKNLNETTNKLYYQSSLILCVFCGPITLFFLFLHLV